MFSIRGAVASERDSSPRLTCPKITIATIVLLEPLCSWKSTPCFEFTLTIGWTDGGGTGVTTNC